MNNETEYTGTWAIANENGEIYMAGLSETFAKAVVDEELNEPYNAPFFMMTPDGLLSNGNKKYPEYLEDYAFGYEDEAYDALNDLIEPYCTSTEKVYADNEEWIFDMESKSHTVQYTFHAFNTAE